MVVFTMPASAQLSMQARLGCIWLDISVMVKTPTR